MDDLRGPDAVDLLRQAAAASREALGQEQSELSPPEWELLLDRVEKQLDDEDGHP